MLNRATCFALLVVALLMANAPPAGAQGAGNNCDISGTWYGGSDPNSPYLWTITSTGNGRYTSVAQQAYPFSLLPKYAGVTNWSIDVNKLNDGTYGAYGMSYWVYRWAGLKHPQLPELDIVHSSIRFDGCDTIKNTIDVFGVYYEFDSATMTPFVTKADVDIIGDYNGGKPIEEIYRRMK